jgi:hypothetical protein
MTVENQTNKVREDGDGVIVDFDFSFEVFSAADLEVYKVVKATGVATLQTITTDYTVALNTASAGGTVTYVTAPTALQESFIKRVVDLTQETDIPNVGGLREEQIENALDRGTMVDQQLQEQIDRCPKLPSTTSVPELSIPEPEAGKYLGWNDDEDALENKSAPTSTDYPGDIDRGLDAGKAASPAEGDIYFATDTGKLYLCLSAGSWTWYNPTTLTTRGDVEYYGASGLARLAAGTSGYFLKTLGAGADPAWAEVLPQIKEGSFSRDISLASGSQSITGIGFMPRALIIYGCVDAGPSCQGTATASSHHCVFRRPTDGNFYYSSNLLQFQLNATPDQAYATLTSFDADGLTLAWTKVNSPTGTANFNYIAIR